MKFSMTEGLLPEQDSKKGYAEILDAKTKALYEWLIDNGEDSDEVSISDIEHRGSYYDTDEFEVNGVDGIFAVGTEDEMISSSTEYLKDYIDEMGFEGFSESFLEQFIDEDEVAEYARDFYDQDVYDNPESYLDESRRMLSSQQKEQVDIFEMRKDRLGRSIEQFLKGLGGENDEWYRGKIKELEGIIEEYDVEIEMIKSDPDGGFPEELVSQVIDNNVREVKRNPMQFIDDFGLEVSNFINRREFIQEVIDTDGYGHTLNRYDGNADEVFVDGDLFFVMRID
jgi:hypothetical protein